ncbi:phage tail terminator family protein [Clostridium paraputrificum]|uniref:phage tail terminator family protein n=1 Tax=Clostridium paraputrificum TaxID=29363 RepID=UPI003D3360A1
MNISEIISAITKTIKNNYPEITIYKDKIQQGFETPCFFITCLNVEQKKVGRNKYARDYLFSIRFHMESPEMIELLQKGEELQELLQELNKDGQLLIGKELNYEVVDDVLQFYVSYKQRLIKVGNKGPSMESLDLNEGVN